VFEKVLLSVAKKYGLHLMREQITQLERTVAVLQAQILLLCGSDARTAAVDFAWVLFEIYEQLQLFIMRSSLRVLRGYCARHLSNACDGQQRLSSGCAAGSDCQLLCDDSSTWRQLEVSAACLCPWRLMHVCSACRVKPAGGQLRRPSA
jgi:hypothetical protein